MRQRLESLGLIESSLSFFCLFIYFVIRISRFIHFTFMAMRSFFFPHFPSASAVRGHPVLVLQQTHPLRPLFIHVRHTHLVNL